MLFNTILLAFIILISIYLQENYWLVWLTQEQAFQKQLQAWELSSVFVIIYMQQKKRQNFWFVMVLGYTPRRMNANESKSSEIPLIIVGCNGNRLWRSFILQSFPLVTPHLNVTSLLLLNSDYYRLTHQEATHMPVIY